VKTLESKTKLGHKLMETSRGFFLGGGGAFAPLEDFVPPLSISKVMKAKLISTFIQHYTAIGLGFLFQISTLSNFSLKKTLTSIERPPFAET
jgi:hypothetical protein